MKGLGNCHYSVVWLQLSVCLRLQLHMECEYGKGYAIVTVCLCVCLFTDNKLSLPSGHTTHISTVSYDYMLAKLFSVLVFTSFVFTLLNVVTGRMPQSGKLPVLNLLTGQKSALHRFKWNFARPRGTRVRLVTRNFTPIGARGWERGPQNIKYFHFLVKSRLAGANSLTDF